MATLNPIPSHQDIMAKLEVDEVPTTQTAWRESDELTSDNIKAVKATAGKPQPFVRDKETLPSKKDIRDSIPKHLFKHSYAAALYELARDLLIVSTFAVLAYSTLRTQEMRAVDWLGWAFYSFFQGSAFTGLWVLAHECGHGGFSASRRLNNAVGYVLHTSLLVPYYAWQFSHAKHHAKTNHLMDGESHNPDSWDDYEDMLGLNYHKLHEAIGDDAFAAWQLFTHLVVGWPVYLLTNATGGRRAHGGKPIDGKVLDHFRPSSALFPVHWQKRIAASTVGVIGVITALCCAGTATGIGGKAVALLYVPSYFVCNGWLVLYTWLQHTHEDMPHYGDDEWTWVRGALSTIDRPYSECFGFHDWMHHRIGSTHVFHHLFSDGPCYNAVEATKHLKAYLAPLGLYNYDGRPILQAAWQTAKRCQYVEGTEGVQYFKSLKDAKAHHPSVKPGAAAFFAQPKAAAKKSN